MTNLKEVKIHSVIRPLSYFPGEIGSYLSKIVQTFLKPIANSYKKSCSIVSSNLIKKIFSLLL